MKHARFSLLLLASILLCAPLVAAPQQMQDQHPDHAKHAPVAIPPETAARTQHSVTIDGHVIKYTATAGTLLLHNRKGQVIGSMFYIAYTRNGEQADHRPVTFAYNGGPGAASALVDIGGFGPMHVVWPVPGGDPRAAQPPYALEPNPYSILKSTDLVFIDAMGTGYSRIVGKGAPKDFYGVSEDARAFAQFIQRYLSVNHRWNSPKFLLGESYGTTRNAVLANDLVDAGVNLNGVIMCSTGLDFLTIDNAPGNDLPFISYLPSYAAIAWYHHRLNPMPPSLPALVKQVEQFAGTTYAQALFKGATLPATEKQKLAAQLSAYTGLPASLWLKADLRVPLSVFQRNVMGNGTMTGRYDERFTTYELQPLKQQQGYGNIGASSRAFNGGLTAGMNRYLAENLKYHTRLPYLQEGRIHKWNWNYRPPMGGEDMGFGAGPATCCGTNVAPALARAMSNDPAMQLMMNNGYYDTATPFFGTIYTLHHMGLPAALEKNVHWFFYPVGHMLYLNPKVLPKVDANIDAFIENASAK
ncbi:MAG TPA: peptidase S10 [Rhodanobacteraceae bacterium]